MNFKECLTFLGMMAVCLTGAMAAPENPAPFTIDNQGDSLTLRRAGDEHYNYVQTVDGFLVLQDSAGTYFYADEFGKNSFVKAKNSDDRGKEELLFLKSLDRNAAFIAHRKNNPPRLISPEKTRKRASWVPSSSAKALMKMRDPAGHSKGTNRFPIILAAGTGSSNCDSLAYYNRLNQEGYNKNKHTGSVRDYFVDQSNGQFVPSFDLYVVTVPQKLSTYKGSEELLVKDALNSLKTKYPNFDASPYDADNDGYVDMVAVIFAGSRTQAGLGGLQFDLHYTSVGALSIGGKKFDRYIIAAQMEESSGIKNIGSFIHEFGHTMGLEDLYSVYTDPTEFSTQYPGAHAWDVMASGMYNNDGATPAGYSAFEKEFLGWMEYKTLDKSKDVTVIPPLNETDVAYKIPVSGKEDEWFILENRQLTKWDAHLPNHGMLIWHIDYVYSVWYSGRVNDDESHQHVDIVEAGNIKVTDRYDGYYATHLKDDPFPGSQNVTSFAGFKSWAGVDQGIQLYEIMEENKDVCFTTQKGMKVTTCEIPEVVVSSSSVASSSSIASSSSVSQNLIPSLVVSQVRLEMNGSLLEIETASAAAKKVELFDVLGNKIYSVDFYGETCEMDLRPFVGKILVVRVHENGMLLRQIRVPVL